VLNQLLQLIFNGVVTGSVLAIGAIGASLVWGVLRIGNFAHGDYMALGAFTAFLFNVPLGQPLFVAALAGIVVTAIFAIIAHHLVLKPMRGRGLTSVFIVTVGLAFVMRNTLFLTFGSGARSYAVDQAEVYVLGPVRVSPGQAITVLAAVISIAFVAWLLSATSIGRSMRAASENSDLAAVTGVNTDRLATVTWLITGCLAGLAGICMGLVQGTFDASFGAYTLFLIFTAVVLGGIGSAYGALGGGLALGLAMDVSTWDGFAGGLDPRYKLVLAFVALILLLIIRPEGLFGKARLI
jgi:branched-subunit amino acid ABC-type transport system permease component